MNVSPIAASGAVTSATSMTASTSNVDSARSSSSSDRVTLSMDGLKANAMAGGPTFQFKMKVKVEEPEINEMIERAGDKAMDFFTNSVGMLFERMDDAQALGMSQPQFDEFKSKLDSAIEQHDYEGAEKLISENIDLGNPKFMNAMKSITDRTVKVFESALSEEFGTLVYYNSTGGGDKNDDFFNPKNTLTNDDLSKLDYGGVKGEAEFHADQGSSVEEYGQNVAEGAASQGVKGTRTEAGFVIPPGAPPTALGSNPVVNSAGEEVDGAIKAAGKLFRKELSSKISDGSFFSALEDAVAGFAVEKLKNANQNKYSETMDSIVAGAKEYIMGAVLGTDGLEDWEKMREGAEGGGFEANANMMRGAAGSGLAMDEMVEKAMNTFKRELEDRTNHEMLGRIVTATAKGVLIPWADDGEGGTDGSDPEAGYVNTHPVDGPHSIGDEVDASRLPSNYSNGTIDFG